ncbi:apolipoprotein N-acyltransferase [Treponema zioleckii]|uniref:apolipoprotein N-acyltransferase n=1 Tax=Treponema zioleckii TaxID=331680 RepID=UPI00168B4E5A|nr:apolipoprotein N-acyltransferase [Treponema zioleckii]
MLSFAIPNEFLLFGSPFIGFFSLTPLYIMLSKAKSYREAFWLCFLNGALTHFLSSFWLGNFMGYAAFTLGASGIGTGFVEGFLSFFFYYFIAIFTKQTKLEETCGKKTFFLQFRIIWFASLYSVWEWVKSTGFLGYPWGTVSMTAFKWPLITQIADITGVYGITWLFAFFSAIIGEGSLIIENFSISEGKPQLADAYKKIFSVGAVFLGITTFYGIYQYTLQRVPVKYMNTVFVQQSRDPWEKTEKARAATITLSQKLSEEKITEFADEGITTDLVVWSEAVLQKRFPKKSTLNYYATFPEDEPLFDFIKRMGTPFIIGGPYVLNDWRHEYGNSALLFDRNGILSGSYQKMHLVPFAELIPYRQFDFVRILIKKLAGFSYGWTPGKKPVLFEIPLSGPYSSPTPIFSLVPDSKKEKTTSVKISTPICFDDSAAEVCRALFFAGSEIFVNITNDSWSKTDSAEIQHFVVAHYRAIEYRTTLARSANAGYSVVVDPAGKVLADMPLFTPDAMAVKVPIFERKITIYAKFGNWLPEICAILAAAFIIYSECRTKEKIEYISTECLVNGFWLSELEEQWKVDWTNWNI